MAIWVLRFRRAIRRKWNCSAGTIRRMSEPVGLGRFDGKVCVLAIRIYYEDTDLSGVVYHANYLRYMERGRTEFFRLAGVPKMAMLEDAEPTAWTLRNVSLDFLKP